MISVSVFQWPDTSCKIHPDTSWERGDWTDWTHSRWLCPDCHCHVQLWRWCCHCHCTVAVLIFIHLNHRWLLKITNQQVPPLPHAVWWLQHCIRRYCIAFNVTIVSGKTWLNYNEDLKKLFTIKSVSVCSWSVSLKDI